ncbi:MAG: symmetrical bis(5'-nucleosyl)-tetraphosphatase [Bradymonadaceae bacterium]|nr:symmetrical bis(5'-nucleosyl)-tetraphosphatase [Lujinxingiaceae bacterium]
MSTYAIGDLHGNMEPLKRLLDTIAFDSHNDRLWFVGDLVNGGPDTLEVLRWVRERDALTSVVLGNHDLHMLAVAAGAQTMRSKDTFQSVFEAPDGPELLNWLRHRPMIHREGEHLMVHAGLMPQWSVEQAEQLARDIEIRLQGDAFPKFLRKMYGNSPRKWREGIDGMGRLRLGVNAMTRMRVLSKRGNLDFAFKGEYSNISKRQMAWFDAPERRYAGVTVICGHWSALGVKIRPDLLALDSGCVWGRQLTAVRLEDRAIFQVSCAG